jgi:UPF0755 protein
MGFFKKLNQGLKKTRDSMSGAINAALYPDESYVAEKYLYFCSKDPDTGELHFSRTLEEHERAVEIYAPLWQIYDAERGM